MDVKLVVLQKENIPDAETALRYLAGRMFENGMVKETYEQAIVDRENIFPTGLKFPRYGVAIPHTDGEHVVETTFSIMTLDSPVEFVQMATNGEKISVNLIIMLAIKEAHGQVEMLQKLMTFLQNEDIVNEILNYKQNEQEKVVRLLENSL